jgi:hypothetical protein
MRMRDLFDGTREVEIVGSFETDFRQPDFDQSHRDIPQIAKTLREFHPAAWQIFQFL